MTTEFNLHIRHTSGQSHDLNLADLNLSESTTDAEIVEAVANFMDMKVSDFSGMVVDRRPGGQVMLHPEAVYG